MQIVYAVCCGLDVHQATLTACLRRVSDDGQITTQLREDGTTYPELLALSDWLVAQDCPVVAMESTGVYWKPIYHVLSGVIEVVVGNARERRPRPGKKTDKADATWIAELLAHGLIRPSFVPPPAICALRDLTRTRVGLVQTRTQAKNRVQQDLGGQQHQTRQCGLGCLWHQWAADAGGLHCRRARSPATGVDRSRALAAQAARAQTRLDRPVH